MYPGTVAPLPWGGYLAEEDGQFVGTCAYKTPPQSGQVEIAYFTFPGQEGRGVATRMARQLIGIAQREGVAVVVAQTLPEPGASTAILQKLGFRRAGEVIHPEDGLVWQWELQRD
nr:GNAT family protein [Cupriavidus sp. AU9028]